MARALRARRREERGGVLVFVGVLSTAIVVLAAFAVDLGMQRVSRRDMQAIADIVALDLARELDGGVPNAYLSDPTWVAAMESSAVRNAGTTGSSSACSVVYTPQLHWRCTTAGGNSLGKPPVLTVELGTLDPASGSFQALPANAAQPADAVRVNSSSSVKFGFRDGDGGVGRSAVAAQEASACFGAGSYAVRLATQNSVLLNSMLGDALGTTVLGYDGLAEANVSLAGITAALTAGSPNGVLDPSHVTLGKFVLAAATALGNTPGNHSADIAVLQSIYSQLDLPNQVLDLGELIDVGTGDLSAVDATVNVLDLVYGAAIFADGNHLVGVPNLTVALPGVTNITTSLDIIEAPQTACDDGTAQTSQVTLTIRGRLSVGIPLVATVEGDIEIKLDLATAEVLLSDVHCLADGTADSIALTVRNQSLAATTIDLSQVGVRPLLLPRIPLANLVLSTNQRNPSGTFTLPVPTYYAPNMYPTPQGASTVPALTAADLSVAGINLGSALTPVLNLALNPLIAAVNGLVTNTANPLLGLNLAGVDLFALPTPSCGKPRLRG